jgi:fumarylpyruvate hydrolase
VGIPVDYVFSPPPRPSLAVAGTRRRFPVHRVYCVGRNYAAHAREMGGDPAREAPFFFCKPADAVTQSGTVAYPPRTADLHHEVELVVAIGRAGQGIAVAQALEYVFGYAVGVDLTRRDLQAGAKAAGRPWDTAKGFDQSAPMSDLHPAAAIGHPAAGRIALRVGGDLRQSGDLREMIWSVPEVLAELSTYFELRPGDLVFTGTPEGVAPLQPGERVEASIEGVDRFHFEMAAAET